MRKVGIVSYNIYCNFTNYGSALQSYALYTAIGKISPNSKLYLINYCPSQLADKNPLDPFPNMWDKDEQSRKALEKVMPAIRENYWKFDSFYKNRFCLTEKCTDENFDAACDKEGIKNFVCGSDTIFCILEFGGFVEGYFANHRVMKENYSCSYAASFGDAKFDAGQWKGLINRLKNFKRVGVREATYVDELKSQGIPIQRVIDPTLLLTAADYDRIAESNLISENYLLLYSRRGNAEMLAYAEEVAKRLNLKIVDISLQCMNHADHIPFYRAGVEEFLSLIKHAQYVVTNSYHGAIFAIQYQRPLAVFSREQADTKIGNLLSLLGCEEIIHTVNDGHLTKPDYEAVSVRLQEARRNSIQFLKEIIKGMI